MGIMDKLVGLLLVSPLTATLNRGYFLWRSRSPLNMWVCQNTRHHKLLGKPGFEM